MDSPEASAVRALVQYLRARYGADCVLLHARIDVQTQHVRLKVDLEPSPVLVQGLAPEPAQVPEQGTAQRRTEVEQAILRVLGEADRPLKGRTVANRVGQDFGPTFRKIMSRLVKAKLVEVVSGEGYRLCRQGDREPNTNSTGTS